LPDQTVPVVTLWIRLERHLGEEIAEGIVAQIVGNLAEIQQILQGILDEKASRNAHGGGQRGGAHALPFEGLLVNVLGHHQGRSTSEAGSVAGTDELNVPRDGILRNARLEPVEIPLIAGRIDGHAGLEVVHTAKHQIHRLTSHTTALRDGVQEAIKVIHRRDVVVVRLDLYVRVDEAQRGGGGLYFGEARLVGREEQTVHVGQLHLVVVEQDQFANAAAAI